MPQRRDKIDQMAVAQCVGSWRFAATRASLLVSVSDEIVVVTELCHGNG
jgi:hypothetical protein